MITAEYQGTYDDLHTKLKSAFIANEQPAISVMEIASIQSFADAGMIECLDEIISDEKENNFLPGLMDNSYVDSKLYGVPYLEVHLFSITIKHYLIKQVLHKHLQTGKNLQVRLNS